VESASVLESIAEVAIALAGFGGIAAGLGYRAREEWSSEDRLRLISLAVISLAVVFACFLPYVTHHLGSTAPWRMASALYLPMPTLGLVYQVWFARRGLPAGYSRIAALLVFAARISSSALLLTVALGYAGPREFGFYLSAVLLALFQASLFFVRLLVASFPSSEPAA
jgi:hypothetical protein